MSGPTNNPPMGHGSHDPHGHDDHHDDHRLEGAAHGTMRDYVTGFVLAVILTVIPFWIVMNRSIESSSMTALVILLIGERPGLGQSESLSCYMVYGPTKATVEAERTCLSNIHRGGTPPVEAAGVIVDLAKQMLAQKVSGIALAKR